MRAHRLLPILGLVVLGLSACKDEKKDTTGSTAPPAGSSTTAPANPAPGAQPAPPPANKPAGQ